MPVLQDDKHIKLRVMGIFLMNFGSSYELLLVIKVKDLFIYDHIGLPQICSVLNSKHPVRTFEAYNPIFLYTCIFYVCS